MKKLMLAMMTVAAASVFGSFSYQGALKLADGTAVTELTKSIEFRLYADATGNNVLWAGQASVLLASGTGVFNTEISDSLQAPSDFQGTRQPLDTVLAANANETLYLGLTVIGSNGEIRPRQKLLAVPTASFAHNVKKADAGFTVQGATVCQGAVSAQGNMTVAGTATLNGEVTMGNNATVSGNVTVNGKLACNTPEGAKEVVPVPVGGIIMWTQSNAPDGEAWATGSNSGHWAICNGQDNINGLRIPDLRGRFVVGVNDTTTGQSDAWKRYAVTDQGGEENHLLTVAEMPVHSHLYGMDSAWRSNGWNMGSIVSASQFNGYSGSGKSGCFIRTGTAGGNSTDSVAGTSSDAHNNLPPYYALYYIMRVR